MWNKTVWYLVGSTALTFGQIQRILFTDGGLGFASGAWSEGAGEEKVASMLNVHLSG